ncbi:hypothetical protein J4727_03365 [Providencia rettgeri]|uniref:Uncharacterized protein n=1 Tax=Providencia rettgeri TaxID=587 RepID=A0A939SNV9_PRORE|nr:hypothetical protein [Providencia rettgeri]
MNKNSIYNSLPCNNDFIFSVKSFGYDAIFNITGRVSSNTCSVQSSRIQNVHLGDYTIGQSGFGSGVNTQSKDVMAD